MAAQLVRHARAAASLNEPVVPAAAAAAAAEVEEAET